MIDLSSRPALAAVDRFFEFSLLGLLASGYLAVASSGRLDAVTVAVAGAAILARALVVAGLFRIPLAGRWTAVITLLYAGFYAADLRYVSRDFLVATVRLVLFLAAVKILTARTRRDHLYVIVIAFLELLAGAMLSASLSFLAFLALFLVFAVATLASWEIRHGLDGAGGRLRRAGRGLTWRLAGLTGVGSLAILLFMSGLFFVLPRTARAAFERLMPERYHLSGFSDRVRLGEIGEIKQQNTPVMHIRVPGARDAVEVKWRGNALAEFDGLNWFNSAEAGEPLRVRNGLLQLAGDDERRRPGRRLNYEVHLRSIGPDLLFIGGEPEFLRINAPVVMRGETGGLRAGHRSASGIRYGVYSYLGHARSGGTVAPLPREQREKCLALPALDPRIAALARRLAASHASAGEQARAIETHLSQNYGYTARLPEREQADPIAHFLFDRRQGHCEYFASAMAVMLRAVGIPSRVATGFQSGVYNPLSGWQVVRTSDAHSWVEAYLPDRGWTTFDPTPAVATGAAGSVWARFSLVLDAAETFWEEWVVAYDLEHQFALAQEVEKSSRRFSFDWLSGAAAAWRGLRENGPAAAKRYGPVLAGGVLLAAALLWLGPGLRRRWRVWHRSRRLQEGKATASDATVLYLRALAMLERRGYQRPAWLTPREFAAVLPPGPPAGIFRELTAAYNEIRFGGDRAAAARLITLLEDLAAALRLK